MKGSNPIRKPLLGDGSRLEVKEIFYTLQGEGIFAGHPAVFVRLGGCNLACFFCDTYFEDYIALSLIDIINKVKLLASNKAKLVVITGGEPFRQPIERLCKRLLRNKFTVQIETNGTLYRPIDKRVKIICSPKMVKGAYHSIRQDLLPHITAFKFLISTGKNGYNNIPEVGQGKYNIPVYVQPMDEGSELLNQRNLMHATAIALEKGYRLSIQMHKLANIP